jgi:hypothetical protein
MLLHITHHKTRLLQLNRAIPQPGMAAWRGLILRSASSEFVFSAAASQKKLEY